MFHDCLAVPWKTKQNRLFSNFEISYILKQSIGKAVSQDAFKSRMCECVFL